MYSFIFEASLLILHLGIRAILSCCLCCLSSGCTFHHCVCESEGNVHAVSGYSCSMEEQQNRSGEI